MKRLLGLLAVAALAGEMMGHFNLVVAMILMISALSLGPLAVVGTFSVTILSADASKGREFRDLKSLLAILIAKIRERPGRTLFKFVFFNLVPFLIGLVSSGAMCLMGINRLDFLRGLPQFSMGLGSRGAAYDHYCFPGVVLMLLGLIVLMIWGTAGYDAGADSSRESWWDCHWPLSGCSVSSLTHSAEFWFGAATRRRSGSRLTARL